MAKGNWIKEAVPESHKGRLHAALHVPEGQPIPAAKLAKASNSKNPHMRRMAQFAKTMKGMHSSGGKVVGEVEGKAARHRIDRPKRSR